MPHSSPPPTWPPDALGTIEFGAVLDRVAALAAGPLGAESVRARRPVTEADAVRAALVPVAELLALLGRGDRLLAEAVPDVRPALARLRLEGVVLDPPELLALGRLLAASRAVAQDLRRVVADCPVTAALEVPVPDRRLEHRLELSIDADGSVLDAASPALAAARRAVQDVRRRVLKRLEAMLRELGDAAPSGAAVTVRGGRYVIPVRRDSRSRPRGIVHDESGSAGTLFLEPEEVVELGNALREAERTAEREVLLVLQELSALLRPAREAMLACLGMCVAVDDLVARARWAHGVGATVPDVAAAPGPLRIARGRHPLLVGGETPVVPFDLALEGEERTLLVSGPNTGGKTVLMKATALACALAQAGIVPPVGPGTTLPVFARCFADIGDRQSIAASLSTFSAHVAELGRILAEADEATLVLLDEVGSGTDPAEGAALAAAVLAELTRRRACTLASTHLGALKALATEVPGVVNGSLEFDEATLAPTYRFRKGVPGRSYGLAIARRLGLPAATVTDAETRLPSAERRLDELLAAAERRARELDERGAELAARAVAAAAREARLAEQLAAADLRRRDVERREKQLEKEGQQRARQYLLDARRQVEAAIAAAQAAASEAAAREARRLVEEGIREGQARLAALDAAERAPAAPLPAGSAVTVGARVRLPNGLTGDVLEVREDGTGLFRVGGLKLKAPLDGVLVLPGSERRREPRADASRQRGGDPLATTATDGEVTTEIHLRGMTTDEAEQALIAALDAAVLAEQPFLRIVHGKGTGAVRDRVRRVLAADRRVARFDFAPAPQGGLGVTVAEFR